MKRPCQTSTVLVLVAVLTTAWNNVATANSATGHLAVGVAMLVEMTEKPGDYVELHKNTDNKLILTKLQNGKYDFNKLNPQQEAFLIGTIAPDGKTIPDDHYVDNWHYFDPQGRVASIFQKAEAKDNKNKTIDYAFGYGTMSHVHSDWLIHPLIPQVRQDDNMLNLNSLKWQHINVEALFDNNTLVRAVEQKYGSKIDRKGKFTRSPGIWSEGVKGIIDDYVGPTGRVSLTRGWITEVGEGKDKYDVYEENINYYLKIYLKCKKCGYVTIPYGKKGEKDDRTEETIQNDKDKRESNSELIKYAKLAKKIASDALEKIEASGPNNIIGEVIEKWSATFLKAIIKTANGAQNNSKNVDMRDNYTLLLHAEIAEVFGFGDVIEQRRLEEVNKNLNLGIYIAEHLAAFQKTSVLNNDLDDTDPLPPPYRPCCPKQENKKDDDDDYSPPEPSGSFRLKRS